MQKELTKCLIAKQILNNKISNTAYNQLKVENSKLDVGVSKLFLNRQSFL